MAVSGQTEQEQPHATEQLQCEHAQKGQNARGEQPGTAPKPAQEPASVGPHDTWAHTIEQTGTPGPVKRYPAGALQVTVVEPEAVRQEDPRVQA